MLYIVNDLRAPYPPGTFVRRYDQGYVRAIMEQIAPGRWRYLDDASSILLPHSALDLFVYAITPEGRGCSEFIYAGIEGVQRRR